MGISVTTATEGDGPPSTLVERGLVWDAGLYARHMAALHIVNRGIEDDRELLLSYVVWPTDLMQIAGQPNG